MAPQHFLTPGPGVKGSVNDYGNDRHAGASDHQRHAGKDRANLAILAARAFGIHVEDVSLVQSGDRLFDSADVAATALYRKCMQRTNQPRQKSPGFKEFRLGHVADGPVELDA